MSAFDLAIEIGVFWLGAFAPALPGTGQNTRTPIDTSIHASWFELPRTMTKCKSLLDPKTNTTPRLYLPKGMPEPAELRPLSAACGLRVVHLPIRITHPGQLCPLPSQRPACFIYLTPTPSPEGVQ